MIPYNTHLYADISIKYGSFSPTAIASCEKELTCILLAKEDSFLNHKKKKKKKFKKQKKKKMVRTCVDSTPISGADETVDKMFFWSDDVHEENRDISIGMDLEGGKQTFELSCQFMLERSFKMKLVVNFMDVILKNLNDIIYKNNGDDDEIVLLEILEKKLRLLRNLLFLIPKRWIGFKEMQNFKVAVHAFAYYSASLILMYWVEPRNILLLNLNVQQMIKPSEPVFKAFYFRCLEEMKLRQLDSVISGPIVQIFIELMLENLVDILKDDFQSLEQSLAFVISFLVDPPRPQGEDKVLMMKITAEIEALIKEDLYKILSDDDMKGNFLLANECLRDFMRNIEPVKGKILQVYDQIRDSFSYDFPKTNGLGFFDFLLQNLGFFKEKKLKSDTSSILFAKNLIIKVEEELKSLRPYLDDLFEQQKERKEVKNILLKVIDLAYQTEDAINSCLVTGHPLWYNMARLMDILDKLKDVYSNLKKIEGGKLQDGGVQYPSTVNVSKYPWTPGFNEVTVGLEEEVSIIVGNLINGSTSLDIVAIVGMPGLGKTTLAKKVYNAPAVQNHFTVIACCTVSQVHDTKRVLLDILADIEGKDDKYDDMSEGELVSVLHKRLRGEKYLIVMDDIWNVKAWVEVGKSLPDDQKGSRVIFTTRIQNVASLASEKCVHRLRFLYDEESWELLQNKAFQAEEGCPPDFLEVGEMIAKKCKGLPSTIVSIAEHIAKSERSVSKWNSISEAVGSYVLMEDCMSRLELSYHHLPEHLKPCFLYFGAFAEDGSICVNKLMLLWIAEGFIQNSNMMNLENVARDYLQDLVDRSLVIADERSSYGGIKSCRVHDSIREFCKGKAREEDFLQSNNRYEASRSSSSSIRDPYRVCIHMKGKDPGDATKICPTVCSLLSSRKTYHDDHHYVRNLKLVQVMFLEDLKWDTGFITRVIASLVGLRFIATSYPLESWIKVPSSISNLCDLETLILTGKGSGISKLELPGTVWNMTKLKHVDIGMCHLSSVGLKKGETYPQMVSLESFSSPYISSTQDFEDLLRRSPSLQKLSFHYDPKKGFYFPDLDSLTKLESLRVSSARDPSLHSFKSLSSLKKLSLSDCYLNWKQLPAISKRMPCLEVLKLLDNSFVWFEWEMEKTVFPKLKFLKLQGLKLTDWDAFKGSFPQLEVLIVNRCSKLNAIPICFGEMPTLKRIEVYASPNAAPSVVEIQDVQKELGNDELQVIV